MFPDCRRNTPTSVGKMLEREAATMRVQRNTPTSVGKIDVFRGGKTIFYGTPPPAWGRCDRHIYSKLNRSEHPHQRGEDLDRPQLLAHQCRNTPTSVGKMLINLPISNKIHGTPPPAWGRWAVHRSRQWYQPEHPHQRGEDVALLLIN